MSAAQTTADAGRTAYIITRTAKNNPDIKGRALYMTNIGLWTLDPLRAQEFSKLKAEEICATDNEYKIQRAALAAAKGAN